MKPVARFVVRWQTAIVIGLFMVVTVVMVAKIENEAAERKRDQAAAEHRTCLQTADSRRTFRALLHDVAFPPPASTAGLTNLPSFPPLDPLTRQYLRDLDAELARNNGSPRLQNIYADYVRKVPIPECD